MLQNVLGRRCRVVTVRRNNAAYHFTRVVCRVRTACRVDSGARLCWPRTDVQDRRHWSESESRRQVHANRSLFAIKRYVGAVQYTLSAYPTHLVDCEQQRVRCQYVRV